MKRNWCVFMIRICAIYVVLLQFLKDELARMQDRIKYTDSCEQRDEITARQIHMDLKNTETRIKAIRTINRAYQKIINSMMQVFPLPHILEVYIILFKSNFCYNKSLRTRYTLSQF